MAKMNNERKALIKKIVESLEGLDVSDLMVVEVVATRLSIPVVDEENPVEVEDVESIEFDEAEDGEDLGFEEVEEIEENPLDEDEDGEDEDEDPFADENDDEDLSEIEEDIEDPFADEDELEEPAKPVGRRNRAPKEEKKPAKAAKPAKPAEPEMEKIPAPSPLVRMQKSDANLATRKEMYGKLMEFGIKKSSLEDFEAETLHKGLRGIFARVYGPKAFSLEALEKKAKAAGIEVSFPRGNRGDDLKAQAVLVTLINKGLIKCPGFKSK